VWGKGTLNGKGSRKRSTGRVPWFQYFAERKKKSNIISSALRTIVLMISSGGEQSKTMVDRDFLFWRILITFFIYRYILCHPSCVQVNSFASSCFNIIRFLHLKWSVFFSVWNGLSFTLRLTFLERMTSRKSKSSCSQKDFHKFVHSIAHTSSIKFIQFIIFNLPTICVLFTCVYLYFWCSTFPEERARLIANTDNRDTVNRGSTLHLCIAEPR
jgi:hypothetical protein